MKYSSKILFTMAVCVFFSSVSAVIASQPPAVGGKLPEIVFAIAQSPEMESYLGVSGKQTFTIPEIKAEVVLIEIFSMY